MEKEKSGYVMNHGIAQIVHEEEGKARRWKDEWEFFNLNKSKDHILIKVSTEWMEVVSCCHRIVSTSYILGAPKVVFQLFHC
jgi:general stress protein 26